MPTQQANRLMREICGQWSLVGGLQLIAACFAAGTLFAAPAPPPAPTNNAGFYPLWQKAPPNTTDLVLIYQGGTQRSAWAPGEFAPYVSAADPRDHKEKWLFDGFLFIEYVNGRKHAFEEGLKLPPADKQDWEDLLARNFEPGQGLAALEQTCAETEKRIGRPLRPRQVVLTLPEPIEGATNWGALDGRQLDFSVPADRVAAGVWHIDRALKKWRELAPSHLTLAGFYFVPERTLGSTPRFLPLIAQKIHERGKLFFWIPYWQARGAADWQQHGFDAAWQQPNYFFHPELPDSRLREACEFARQHGLGLEMELDGRLMSNPQTFAPRFDAYLKAFEASGVKSSSSMAYYEGGGALLRLSKSDQPDARHYYDRLAEWVLDRQRLADEKAAAGPAR
jgi:hypothetical protein